MIAAQEISIKIASIHSKVQAGNAPAALTELNELQVMFVRFCSEIESDVRKVANDVNLIREEING